MSIENADTQIEEPESELATANERIMELEAERDRWYGKATGRAIELAAEREVSNKFAVALQSVADGVYDSWTNGAVAQETAIAVLAEVAAIRKQNDHQT